MWTKKHITTMLLHIAQWKYKRRNVCTIKKCIDKLKPFWNSYHDQLVMYMILWFPEGVNLLWRSIIIGKFNFTPYFDIFTWITPFNDFSSVLPHLRKLCHILPFLMFSVFYHAGPQLSHNKWCSTSTGFLCSWFLPRAHSPSSASGAAPRVSCLRRIIARI